MASSSSPLRRGVVVEEDAVVEEVERNYQVDEEGRKRVDACAHVQPNTTKAPTAIFPLQGGVSIEGGDADSLRLDFDFVSTDMHDRAFVEKRVVASAFAGKPSTVVCLGDATSLAIVLGQEVSRGRGGREIKDGLAYCVGAGLLSKLPLIDLSSSMKAAGLALSAFEIYNDTVTDLFTEKKITAREEKGSGVCLPDLCAASVESFNDLTDILQYVVKTAKIRSNLLRSHLFLRFTMRCIPQMGEAEFHPQAHFPSGKPPVTQALFTWPSSLHRVSTFAPRKIFTNITNAFSLAESGRWKLKEGFEQHELDAAIDIVCLAPIEPPEEPRGKDYSKTGASLLKNTAPVSKEQQAINDSMKHFAKMIRVAASTKPRKFKPEDHRLSYLLSDSILKSVGNLAVVVHVDSRRDNLAAKTWSLEVASSATQINVAELAKDFSVVKACSSFMASAEQFNQKVTEFKAECAMRENEERRAREEMAKGPPPPPVRSLATRSTKTPQPNVGDSVPPASSAVRREEHAKILGRSVKPSSFAERTGRTVVSAPRVGEDLVKVQGRIVELMKQRQQGQLDGGLSQLSDREFAVLTQLHQAIEQQHQSLCEFDSKLHQLNERAASTLAPVPLMVSGSSGESKWADVVEAERGAVRGEMKRYLAEVEGILAKLRESSSAVTLPVLSQLSTTHATLQAFLRRLELHMELPHESLDLSHSDAPYAAALKHLASTVDEMASSFAEILDQVQYNESVSDDFMTSIIALREDLARVEERVSKLRVGVPLSPDSTSISSIFLLVDDIKRLFFNQQSIVSYILALGDTAEPRDASPL